MKKRNVWIILIISVFAVAGIIFVHRGLSGKAETGQPKNKNTLPVVRVISASKTTISSKLDLTGSVEHYRVAHLASPAEGPVMDIHVREGDTVKAGDTMLSIGRKKGIDALITSLQEELKKEADNLQKIRHLVEIDALPGEQLDQARTAYEKVRAQLVNAEETAGDYSITAPWSGVVSRVIVKEGEFIAPRAILLEMYDPASLIILSAVPEKYAFEVKAGKSVDIRLDAYPDRLLEGRIERVYPYLDAILRTRTVEILPKEQIDLLPGMFARLQVLLSIDKDAVVVPRQAVFSEQEQEFVFVEENGKAKRRPVKTGIEMGRRVQIETGVLPGEKVIVEGWERLRDGDTVSALPFDNLPSKKNNAVRQTNDAENNRK